MRYAAIEREALGIYRTLEIHLDILRLQLHILHFQIDLLYLQRRLRLSISKSSVNTYVPDVNHCYLPGIP